MEKKDAKNISLSELMFTEERILTVSHNAKRTDPMDQSLTKAETVNVSIGDYGYVMTPESVAFLAGYSDSVMKQIRDKVAEYTDKVKADPMYKDFPTEVMEMSEAQYRLQQLLHYRSTYGIERMFGVEVSRGWLPDEEGTEKVEDDTSLLSLKVIEVLPEYEAYEKTLKKILSKKERMTVPERDLVVKILETLEKDGDYGKDPLGDITIPFKENAEYVFTPILFNEELTIDERLPLLRHLCQNTGDVFKCLGAALSEVKWMLTTSQKKTFVRLLESYSDSDLAENLWLSKKKSEKAKRYLDRISYNAFARDQSKKDIVKAARDNRLTSFDAQVKSLLTEDPNAAAEKAAERPGWFLRMLTLFYRNGVSAGKLSELLCLHAEKLSVPTLVDVLNAFSEKRTKEDTQERKDIFNILLSALRAHFEGVETPLKGKRVFLDAGDIAPEYSIIMANAKSSDGGYFSSGMAYRIPKEAKNVRFFVYWNDKRRVDVDLHASALRRDGSDFYVGWNASFKDDGVAMSGDITHSNAAEYIQAPLDGDVAQISCSVDLFSGAKDFGDIETCYCGLMAVDSSNAKVKLYNPKNCLVSNELRQKTRRIQYGTIDLQNHLLIYLGKPQERYTELPAASTELPKFSMLDYLNLVAETQDAEWAENAEDADIVLKFGKAEDEKDLSLQEENFFLND